MTATTAAPTTAGPTTGYAPVNGLRLYYESHDNGGGTPLLLLHGGFGLTSMFDALLPHLGKRRVITVDLQGHGRTADVDRPLRQEDVADDIAGLVDHLGLDEVDLFGYSFGALTAL